MPSSESHFSSPQTVVEWQAQLLLRVRLLAAEHSRVLAAGWENFEAIDGDARTAWQAHLDGLEAQREQTEQTALTAGVEPAWIADARELGIRSTHPPAQLSARQTPLRDNAAQDFYMDMMMLDLWHLERMAGVEAVRADRIATGRWSFGANPIAARQFVQNMHLRHQRVIALAHAAEITATEAEHLWGPDAEGTGRGHVIVASSYDELSLAKEWNSYAAPSRELAIPPYIPDIPDGSAAPTAHAVAPPTPQQMITAASASLRAEFVDAALHRDTVLELETAPTVISAAVNAALPSPDTTWAHEPDPTVDAPAPDPSLDLDPDL